MQYNFVFVSEDYKNIWDQGKDHDMSYTMLVEFESGIKSAVFASCLHDAGRVDEFCPQNLVSVSKTAQLVTLPVSYSIGIV